MRKIAWFDVKKDIPEQVGKFHCFGTSYEELSQGVGNYCVAVIEKDDGTIIEWPAVYTRFIDPPDDVELVVVPPIAFDLEDPSPYPSDKVDEIVAAITHDDGEDDSITILKRIAKALEERCNGMSVWQLMDDYEANLQRSLLSGLIEDGTMAQLSMCAANAGQPRIDPSQARTLWELVKGNEKLPKPMCGICGWNHWPEESHEDDIPF